MTYDYYKILDIQRHATLDEIKKAYRAKAKLVHPDINSSAKATEVFKVVNEAYEVLSDFRKRKAHDIQLQFVDASRANAVKQKQYYGNSVKNNTYSNTAKFHYDWNSYKSAFYKEQTDEDYFKKSPWLYNMFFVCGMFLGFLILIICLVGTYRQYWPSPFVLIGVIGIILIYNGWNGILGKQTIYDSFVKTMNSLYNKSKSSSSK
jgi:curved DNA-binding protein CbpA